MPKWRYACPEGHRALRMGFNRVRCKSCNQQYDRTSIKDLQEDRYLEARGGVAISSNRGP